MLLIQQSSSFRTWTSRALMLYFRRALLFLVLSPRQNLNNNNHYVLQKQQTVYFSDAEDEDEDTLIFDKNQSERNLLPKHDLLKEYVLEKLSEGLNNSMTKSINQISSQVIPTDVIYKANTFNEDRVLNNSPYEMNCPCVSLIEYYNQGYTNSIPIHSTFNLQSNLPSSCISGSIDKETLPSESNEQNSFQSSDDSDDIYEKYQNSFSHILHQTKSLHTLQKEDKVESMLVLEPNTSIITVNQLLYQYSNPNYISYPLITSQICIRLIAKRIDLSIKCDMKPMGCKQPTSDHTQQQSTTSSNEKSNPTSILIDIPHKTVYIDS